MPLSRAEIENRAEEVVASLRSSFLIMPRGERFLDFEHFQQAFADLLSATADFTTWDATTLEAAVRTNPRCLVVIRAILGLTPPELAHVTSETQTPTVDQGTSRSVDARAKAGLDVLGESAPIRREATRAMIRAAVELLREPIAYNELEVHRLDKVDTAEGLSSIRKSADEGVPYEALLYERLLGRPFASHRDATSELVGDVVENEIKALLDEHGIPYHKTGRAERIESFDQAPDFFIPDTAEPVAVIEAKVTEDDGTARDKVTRIQRLAILGRERDFAVLACIDGRGFRQRRQDMIKLVTETDGLVFTGATLPGIVPVLQRMLSA